MATETEIEAAWLCPTCGGLDFHFLGCKEPPALDRVRAEDTRDGWVKVTEAHAFLHRLGVAEGSAQMLWAAGQFLAGFSGGAPAGGRTDQNTKDDGSL